MKFDYELWLKQAQDRLEELHQRRAAIDEEIAVLQQGIEGFSPLVKKASSWNQDSIGITKALTRVFMRNPARRYGPTDVRDALVNDGIKLKQRNPLAAIHQVVSRLAVRGVIKPITKDGRTLYYYPENAANQENQSGLPSPKNQPRASPAHRRAAEKSRKK